MPNPTLTADAFVTAFARHGRALWSLAAAWVGRGAAQDLVQEVARVAWQKRAQFAVGSDMRAWLAQIVRHTGANWRRKRQPMPLGDDLPEPTARAEVPTTLRLVDADLPAELMQALQELPDVVRECLLLHVVGELAFPEIATLLDIPTNTAMSHARRARLHLRDVLSARPENRP